MFEGCFRQLRSGYGVIVSNLNGPGDGARLASREVLVYIVRDLAALMNLEILVYRYGIMLMSFITVIFACIQRCLRCLSKCFRVREACCALPSERQLLGSVLVSGPASHLRGREHALREGQHAFVCASLSVFLSIVMCVRVKHAWHPWLLCRRRGSFAASKTRDRSQTASECTTRGEGARRCRDCQSKDYAPKAVAPIKYLATCYGNKVLAAFSNLEGSPRN